MLAQLLILVVPLALAAGVDVNAAPAEELALLPGMGPARAQAVVAFRAEHGPFGALAELDAVPGIGAATLEGLRGRVVFGDVATPVTPVGCGTDPVDLNAADRERLQCLPGVGPALADAILARRAQAPFRSCQELTEVEGMGPAAAALAGGRCVVEVRPAVPPPR